MSICGILLVAVASSIAGGFLAYLDVYVF